MTASTELAPFSLEDFVARQEKKNLLRFIVCGSVDHGKSTLIGRLLYESKLLFDDQLEALARASRNHGTQDGRLDLALVLDGLAAEREQKITIDVAYRFFTTERRKFIIADAPGHEQYTRNMATGASTADLALLVVSAENGLTLQTKRHVLIVLALGVRQIVVAVNKMDLVGWSQAKFAVLEAEFCAFVKGLDFDEVTLIPVAAASGDNVVLDHAIAGQAVTLTLANEIDASRGDVIAEIGATAPVTSRLCARLVWMGEEALIPGKPYMLKLAACTATATLEPGLSAFDLDTRKSPPTDWLPINGIGTGILELDRCIAVDRYADNKETGSFILIDPESYDTVGIGMVDKVLRSESRNPARVGVAIADLIRSTESHARSIAKAASWRITGSLDTFVIAALVTGKPKVAGAVALVEILTKTALYYFHERIWVVIPWGKRPSCQNSDLHS